MRLFVKHKDVELRMPTDEVMKTFGFSDDYDMAKRLLSECHEELNQFKHSLKEIKLKALKL